ncbi:MAG: ATP-binding protein [Ferruginibacter sp.]
MNAKTKILIVEHDLNDLELLQYELKKSGINYVSEIVQNEQEFGRALENFMPDIILSDYSLPSFDGPTAFKMRNLIAPDTPFIFVSGYIGEENSIDFIRNGVTDYVLKDKLFTLATKVKRALKESKEKQEKTKAERELIQSERRMARAQQIAHMGSWELDFDTNVLLFSEEACRIFGLPTNQTRISFKTWSTLIHPEDLDFVFQLIKESRNSLKDASCSHRIVRTDGIVRHIYSESKLEYDSTGKPTGLHGIAHDITELKLAETERTKMVNDLMLRNKDLEQFAYIISHNLRAPVANILGATNVLTDPRLSPEKKEVLRQGLIESVTRLDNIVKDLNHILQVKGEINEAKVRVCFSVLVDDIKISIKNLIDKDNIEIKYDFCKVDEILTLKSYLHSIFYNLISNSIKYRQPRVPAIIEIKSQLVKDKIILFFTDNGMGIDLQKKGEQVFGLYKRFHPNIAGKGMGLYMVKTQVETLGGKIGIRSGVNKGTEIKIEFEI